MRDALVHHAVHTRLGRLPDLEDARFGKRRRRPRLVLGELGRIDHGHHRRGGDVDGRERLVRVRDEHEAVAMGEDGLRKEGRAGRQVVNRGFTVVCAFSGWLEGGGRRDVVVNGEAIFPGGADGDLVIEEVKGTVAVGISPDSGG